MKTIKSRFCILSVLVLGIVASMSFYSCSKDSDDDGKGTDNYENGDNNGGNSNASDSEWSKDASLLRTVASYYVGTWYDTDELGEFLIYQKQGYEAGKKKSITSSIEFYQDGTGEEIGYRGGSSSNRSSVPFTWKVVKTMRPKSAQDFLVIKYSDSRIVNLIQYNEEMPSTYPCDRALGFGVQYFGEDDFREWNDWCNYGRYRGGRLTW